MVFFAPGGLDILKLALLYLALPVLGLAAHVIWMRQLAAPYVRQSSLGQRALLMLAACTPVISFYVARLTVARRRTGQRLPLWRLLIPFSALLAIAAGAILMESRYVPEHRTWHGVLGYGLTLGAVCLWVHAVLYMAVSVFGYTRHGPLTSRIGLVSAGLTLLFAL